MYIHVYIYIYIICLYIYIHIPYIQYIYIYGYIYYIWIYIYIYMDIYIYIWIYIYIYIYPYIYPYIYIYITCSLIHDKPRALQLKGLFRTRQGPFCDLGELEADCSHEENWLRKRANGRENHGETIDNEVGRYWEDHGMIWIWDTSNHQSNLAGKIENCHL